MNDLLQVSDFSHLRYPCNLLIRSYSILCFFCFFLFFLERKALHITLAYCFKLFLVPGWNVIRHSTVFLGPEIRKKDFRPDNISFTITAQTTSVTGKRHNYFRNFFLATCLKAKLIIITWISAISDPTWIKELDCLPMSNRQARELNMNQVF